MFCTPTINTPCPPPGLVRPTPGPASGGDGAGQGLGPACGTRGVCPRVQGMDSRPGGPRPSPLVGQIWLSATLLNALPVFHAKYSSWVCSGRLRGCLLPVPQGPARPPRGPAPLGSAERPGPVSLPRGSLIPVNPPCTAIRCVSLTPACLFKDQSAVLPTCVRFRGSSPELPELVEGGVAGVE